MDLRNEIREDLDGASLVAQPVKSPPALQETDAIPGSGKIPWRRKWQPTPVFLAWKIPWPEESFGLHRVHGVTESWTWLSD